ncbi:MAG: hypothetical protein KKH98_10530 [Spirochaetes bacterium]|nr:hypothetical protein [Spirochaetota bacterium]
MSRSKILFITAFLLIAFIFFFTRDAHVSITHLEKISLSEVIKRSSYILVVEKQSPFEVIKKIKIHKDTKKYPPFEHAVFYFQVIEELYNKDTQSLKNEKIKVLPPDLKDRLYLHKKYYLEGSSKSPIYLNYETKADFYKSKKLIIFLGSKEDGSYLMTVSGGYEKISKKKKIISLIKKLK